MLKRYEVREVAQGAAVVLEVDHSILTKELASELMDYWSGADYYIKQSSGDPVAAAIKLAGMTVLRVFQAEGGGEFDDVDRSPFGPQSNFWTKELHRAEGWGSVCGIRVISGYADSFDYDNLELSEC